VRELAELLEALGLEVRHAGGYVVGEARDDDELVRVYLAPGEARLERRRVEAEEVRPATLAGVEGQLARRTEVTEVFFARDPQNLARLVSAWLNREV